MVPVDPHFAVSPAAHGDSTMTSDEIVQLSKKHTIFEWTPQAAANPVAVARAEGIYFWTPEGKRFIDFNSQLMCVNIGHGDERVVRAIQDQAARLPYVSPFMATEPRARLGRKLAELCPGDIDVFFFTNGGAEANENAVKLARWEASVQKPDGSILVVEFKTGRVRPIHQRQLDLYVAAARQLHPDVPSVGGTLLYL